MRRVLLIEDDRDLREGLSELLALLGAEEVVAVASFEELVRAGDAALETAVAILDVNLGHQVPSGVDAFSWLRQQGYRGEVIFLTGHASGHPLVQAARTLGVKLLEKPVESEALVSLLGGDGGLPGHAP